VHRRAARVAYDGDDNHKINSASLETDEKAGPLEEGTATAWAAMKRDSLVVKNSFRKRKRNEALVQSESSLV